MGGPEIVTSSSDLEQGQPRSRKPESNRNEMRKVPQSAYHGRVVKPKLQHRPWLEILDQFMDPSAKGFAIDLSRRMWHFDLKVIHISPSGTIDSIAKCVTPEMFQDEMQRDKERGGTLVIAKDLSRAMIEALGTQFELEPEFFANHLGGTESFGMGYRESPTLRAPARAPKLLPDYIRKVPFYAAEYRRPYHIEGGFRKVLELRATVTCTPRGAQILKEDLPDVFVFEKISVYKRKGSNIGIVLTDQLLSQDAPASYILQPVSLLNDDLDALGRSSPPHHHPRYQQISSRRELLTWLQNLPPSTLLGLFSSTSPLAMLPILKIVECTSTMFLAHARYIMNRILTRHCDAAFPDSIPFFLHVARSLHRHIHDQQKLLRYAVRVASLQGVDGASGGGGGGEQEDVAVQMRDFAFLAEDMGSALKALEEDVRFLVAAASIREGKIVGWVSKFAALFLPVSLLATILAISDPGYTRWAILGGLSVPFVLVSVYFMFFWKPAHLDSLRF